MGALGSKIREPMGAVATRISALRSGDGPAETKVNIAEASDELIDELTVLTKCEHAFHPSKDAARCSQPSCRHRGHCRGRDLAAPVPVGVASAH